MHDIQPSWWCEPPDFCDQEMCLQCRETAQRFDECQDFLKDIVHQLYSGFELDLGSLEKNLEELCHYMSVRLPTNDLQIMRRRDELVFA